MRWRGMSATTLAASTSGYAGTASHADQRKTARRHRHFPARPRPLVVTRVVESHEILTASRPSSRSSINAYAIRLLAVRATKHHRARPPHRQLIRSRQEDPSRLLTSAATTCRHIRPANAHQWRAPRPTGRREHNVLYHRRGRPGAAHAPRQRRDTTVFAPAI